VKSVTVIGSGASAVHFAQSALERGWSVTLFDVGRARPEHVRPELSFSGLKTSHAQASEYFLGQKFSGVLFPGTKGEYYGFAPHREYIFAPHRLQKARAQGLDPLISFARGVLAEAWTGAVFPFSEAELRDWPIGHGDLAEHYDEVARRIGVVGALDDLAAFVPGHAHMDAPLELDAHSRRLFERYAQVRERINRDCGVFMGRTRAALLTRARGTRQACDKKGRCLWGCPNDAIYTPLSTLRELEGRANFRYVHGVYVRRFETDDGGRVQAIVFEREGGGQERAPVERLVLAAGTLGSSRILLESLAHAGDRRGELRGLMDNRQVLVPFVNFSMLREKPELDSYQYHQLALGLAAEDGREYVHGLVTTLKAALIHPIAQSVPLGLRSALDITRHAHAALGLVNLNFCDTRREQNRIVLEQDGEQSVLTLHYSPRADEAQTIRASLGRLKRTLRALGCFVPPGMVHTRPMGASVHYAGSVPMSASGGELTATPQCKLRGFENIWLADGATFPFLPAKNLTFTLMANAARIAAAEF
jgi:choline dehydrogenase-like flavoprotein